MAAYILPPIGSELTAIKSALMGGRKEPQHQQSQRLREKADETCILLVDEVRALFERCQIVFLPFLLLFSFIHPHVLTISSFDGQKVIIESLDASFSALEEQLMDSFSAEDATKPLAGLLPAISKQMASVLDPSIKNFYVKVQSKCLFLSSCSQFAPIAN